MKRYALIAIASLALFQATDVLAQIKAVARPASTPKWDKGILAINAENYWNAIECGKQGGDDPPCVFWDTGLCQNDDFVLALYTPYKAVAYEVWSAVRKKQAPPTPNYLQAQQTRITLGITPVRGSKNPLKDLVLRRVGKPIPPTSRSINPADSRFTFDYPAFAATTDITLEMIGATRTLTCVIPQPVLTQFR